MYRGQKFATVYYHGGCSDGCAAAAVAYRVFGESPRYIPLSHKPEAYQRIVDMAKSPVLFLDYCPPGEYLEKLVEKSVDVTVLDHHETSREVVTGLTSSVWDGDACGGLITWRYFYGDKAPPRLLRLVDSMDRYVWTEPGSRDFAAYFTRMMPLDFRIYSGYLEDTPRVDRALTEMVESGSVVRRYVDVVVASVCRYAVTLKTPRGTIAIVNSSLYASEIGECLARTSDYGLVWYQSGPRTIHCGVRSGEGGGADELASEFGGGGHRSASGFIWNGDIASLITGLEALGKK